MTKPAFTTHEVFNQSPPFEDVDLFALDRPLSESVAANGGASAEKELLAFGKHWGSAVRPRACSGDIYAAVPATRKTAR